MTDDQSTPTDGDSQGRLGAIRTTVVPSTWREVLNLLVLAVLLAIVIPFVIFAVPQVVGAEQSYVVLSGSMEPAISSGDAIIVNEVPASTIAVGDVITYGGGERSPPTTHRVIDVQEQGDQLVFETKGDANEDADRATTPASRVRGKVMDLPVGIPTNDHSLFVIPLIGYVIQFSQTQLGFTILVAIPIGLLLLSEFWRFVSLSREEGQHTVSEAESEPATDGGATFSVTQNVVIVAIALLEGIGGFAAHYAYQSRNAIVASVAAGMVVSGLLLLTMLVVGSGSGQQSTTEAGRVTDDPVIEGRVPEPLRERPTKPVESPASLVKRAADRGDVVVRDPTTQQYYLFEDDVLYTAAPAESGETASPPTESVSTAPKSGDTEVSR